MTLPAGVHAIEISKAGYGTVKKNISVEKGRVINIREILQAKAAPADTGGEKGWLSVGAATEETKGAEIYLDGVRMEDRTPATLKGLAPGKHALLIRKPLYQDWEDGNVEVFPLSAKISEVFPKLKPNFGHLEIDSEPPGANVFIDGVFTKQAPYQNPRAEARAYRVRVSLDLYKDSEFTAVVTPEKGFHKKVGLEPDFGPLSIKSNPPGAKITLDGTSTGTVTPFTFDRVKRGKHRVRLVKELYEPWEKDVPVAAVAGASESAELRAMFGSIVVSAVSEDQSLEGAKVTIDGEEKGPVGFEISPVMPGRHYIEVSKSGCKSWSGHVEVVRGKQARVTAMLAPSYGWLTVHCKEKDARILIDGKQGQVIWQGFVREPWRSASAFLQGKNRNRLHSPGNI